MVTVSPRFDDDMKALRDSKIPVEIETPDPFHSESNMRNIEESLRQIKEGKVVVKTIEELENMEDE